MTKVMFSHAVMQVYLNQIQAPDDYLKDSKGELLRFDPDNQPAPPEGAGVQLCFKALPRHASRKNTPIPINNVDEFAILFYR